MYVFNKRDPGDVEHLVTSGMIASSLNHLLLIATSDKYSLRKPRSFTGLSHFVFSQIAVVRLISSEFRDASYCGRVVHWRHLPSLPSLRTFSLIYLYLYALWRQATLLSSLNCTVIGFYISVLGQRCHSRVALPNSVSEAFILPNMFEYFVGFLKAISPAWLSERDDRY